MFGGATSLIAEINGISNSTKERRTITPFSISTTFAYIPTNIFYKCYTLYNLLYYSRPFHSQFYWEAQAGLSGLNMNNMLADWTIYGENDSWVEYLSINRSKAEDSILQMSRSGDFPLEASCEEPSEKYYLLDHSYRTGDPGSWPPIGARCFEFLPEPLEGVS